MQSRRNKKPDWRRPVARRTRVNSRTIVAIRRALSLSLWTTLVVVMHSNAAAQSAKAERGWLGVALEHRAAVEGLSEHVQGYVAIKRSFATSAAAEAGIGSGDIVLAVNDQAVHTVQAMIKRVGSHKVGDRITLRLWRAGKQRTQTITLGKRPNLKNDLRARWIGKKFPETMDFVDLRTGAPVGPGSLSGSPSVIEYWATYCGPCRLVLPVIRRMVQRHAKHELKLVAISAEDREHVLNWVGEKSDYDHTLWVDPKERLATSLGLGIMPTLIYLDDTGVIRKISFGTLEAQNFEHFVEVALRPNPADSPR